MGLLNDYLNSEDGRMTLGLLAAAGPQTDPNKTGFGARVQDALGSVDQWKQQQAKDKFMKMQMDNYASEIEQRKAAAQKQAFIQDFIQKRLMGDGGSGNGLTQAPKDVGMGGGSGLTFAGVGGNAGGASPIPASANPGGLGNMSLDDITALKTLGGPDLLSNWKIAKEGFERKPGSFYEGVNGQREYVADPTKGFNADGTLNPKFVASQRTLSSIPEEVRASFDLVDVPMGDGTTRKMPRSEAVKMLSTPDVPSIGSRQPTAQEAALIAADAKANGIQNPVVNLSAKPSGFGQTQSPLEAGRVKNISEATGKVNDTWLKSSYEPTVASGTTAQNLIDSTNVARDALRKIGGGGWGTETKAAGANLLAGLGIASDNAKMYAANAQVFQSKAMERLWSTLNDAKGPQTEGDADRASKTYASLKNTPQANEFVLDMAQAKAERDKAKSLFFKNALPIAQKNGDLAEVEREWDARMPSIFDMPTMKRWAK
jgi:hypothetical protein